MSIDLQNLNEQLSDLQPPSARDRLIFEAVVVKGRGQCEVAAEQGISQPRVSQIVAEVGGWLNRTLPRSRQNESKGGGMAVGEYVAMAQIDFLLQQTLQDITESRKDKVTEKSGKRGVVEWMETKTEKRQIVPVGLLNLAARLSLAKAKLAGVDVSGRAQREAVLAEVRGQESEARGDSEAKVHKPLIKKYEDREPAAEIVQPQVQAVHEDTLLGERDAFVKNTACKQLINHLRRDPECAGWTEKQFQEHAQFIWDLEQQEKDSRSGTFLKGEGEKSIVHSPRDILPVSGGMTKGQQEPRRGRNERQSPEERRRKFLAPLAMG